MHYSTFMTIKREGRPDWNINKASAWLLAIVSTIGICGSGWVAMVWAVKESEVQPAVHELQDRVSQLETGFQDLKMQSQETSDEVKGMVSVQQSIAEALGVAMVRNNLLATNSALAYKPSKNGNESQP